MTYPDGGKYEGEWARDDRHGEGRWEGGGGLWVEGKWVRNALQKGRGRFEFEKNLWRAAYEGEVEGGVPNGRGGAEFADGSNYVGEWVGGVREGMGVFHQGGGVFRGLWKNDAATVGEGVILYDGGGAYCGGIADGLRDGEGEMTYADGSK
jgi:hypothetical protein